MAASVFNDQPSKADKAYARAVEKSLAGGDVAAALDCLGQAPARIWQQDLAKQVLAGLAEQLAAEQVDNPSDYAKNLILISGKRGNLRQRLACDLQQRLVRRLTRWQTGPGAARALACDMHEAALTDACASVLLDNPDKLAKLLGKSRYDKLVKELRKRKLIKPSQKPGEDIERWQWIAILEDISDDDLAEGLYQGLSRYYQLPVRERLIFEFND